MDTHSSLDRESLQELLANAFAVQESQIDTQSLAAVVEMQRLIVSGNLDLEGTMHLVADCVQSVSHATGVAIGLLKGDQLVYRAGSGSAADCPGRQVQATLSVSAGTGTSREILRVEDARTNKRTEAAICRQFGANALLILLIYHDGAPAGLLKVLFREAHVFQDREVRTYRLMAGLIAEVMCHTARDERKTKMKLATVPHTIEQTGFQTKNAPGDHRFVPEPPRQHAVDPSGGPAMTVDSELPAPWHPAPVGTKMRHQRKRVPVFKFPSRAGVPAVVAALVIIAFWVAYNRHPVSPLAASAQKRSSTLEQVPAIPAKPGPGTSKPQTTPVATEKARAAASRFHRVPVGTNEVDYIAEDVTIRYFAPKPTAQWVQGGDSQVNIGEDVTVNHFASKRATVAPTRSVPSPAQPESRSLPGREKAGSSALAR